MNCVPCLSRTIQHRWQRAELRRQRGRRRERVLRRAAARDPRDSFAGEQPESGAVVLRHPQAAYVLHTQLELLRRLRHHAPRLLRRAATPAAPHAQQLSVQPH